MIRINCKSDTKSAVRFDLHQNGKDFILSVPFHYINFARKIPLRRWRNGDKKWIARGMKINARYFMASRDIPMELTDEAQTRYLELGEALLNEQNKIKTFSRKFPATYTFKTAPYNKQKEAMDYAWPLNNSALFMETGTGKSKVVIDLLCARANEKQIKAALVVCPLTIAESWREQFEEHATLDINSLAFNLKEFNGKKQKEVIDTFIAENDERFKVLIVGIQSLSAGGAYRRAFKVAERFLLANQSAMIVDESHTIKTHSAICSQECVKLGNLVRHKMILNGTPISNSPLDLFMQFEFLDPDIIGFGDFHAFKRRYAIMGGWQNKQVVGFTHLAELLEAIKPYTFTCRKDEMIDLPEKIRTYRHVVLDAKQRAAYDQMKKDSVLKTEINGNHIDRFAQNVLVRYTALQQIVAGHITMGDESGNATNKVLDLLPPDKNPKLLELQRIINEECEPDEQIIVWAKYIRELDAIVNALGPSNCSRVYGSVKAQSERDNEIRKFRNGDTRFFISNAAVGGQGLTLNNAHIVIYYSNTFSLKDRLQSEDRCHRIGQKNVVRYIDLIAKGTVDEIIINAIKNKKDLLNFVTDLLRAGKNPLELA